MGLVARDSWLEKTIIEKLVSKNLITSDLAVSKKLREAVLRLSESFTRDRADLSANYFDDEINRLAYLAGFVLTNAVKVDACLRQVAQHLPKDGPLSILDIGTGPGTAVFAASACFKNRTARFTAIEKNKNILDEARSLESLLPQNHSVNWIVGDAQQIPNKHFNLVVAANVINEIKPKEQLKVCRKLLSISDTIIIIDPALKQTTRKMMALRDQLIGVANTSVLAPCTHQNSCPMLAANERDWCHFYFEWKRPKLIESIDRATGLDHRYLKMGYMILLSHDVSRSPSTGHRCWRVVSSPIKTKGKLELFVCGNGEIKRLKRQDKNSTDTNSDFGFTKRGDIVCFTEKERPGEIRALDSFNIETAFTPQPSNP